MSEPQDPDPVNIRPATNDVDAWRAYWQVQGTPWRTQPEISAERQTYLATQRARTPDPDHGVYPFRGIEPTLSRADVEWLLTTHHSHGATGPVAWDDEKKQPEEDRRQGLDLRGADLRRVDLSGLPLARTRAGMSSGGWYDAPSGRREQAMTQLQGTKLTDAQLQDADLHGVHLQDATLTRAQLEQADLSGAHLQRATLSQAHLESADLRFAFLDSATILNSVQCGAPGKGFAKLADVRWGGANLTVVDWSQGIAHGLGDEHDARHWRRPLRKTPAGERPRLRRTPTRLRAFQTAARANRQLAAVMREQGMSEEADRFAYRGHVCQRRVYRREGRLLRYAGALALDLIAGYGYRPLRSLLAYLVVIVGFAGLYLLNAQFAAPHLTWDEALVLSVSSFHGRGFFSSAITLSDTLARLAAGEAVLGLLIEITFIATFTQRFFAR